VQRLAPHAPREPGSAGVDAAFALAELRMPRASPIVGDDLNVISASATATIRTFSISNIAFYAELQSLFDVSTIVSAIRFGY
jgi:hypothetical protein